MAIITALRLGKGRNKKANVSLDGKLALNLEPEVALKEGLKVGQELSASRIEALVKTNRQQSCYDAALKSLGYRPRSEYETRQRLYQRGFDNNSIKAALSRLKEQNLINDGDFARFWRDNRQSFSPRSQWLTRLELKQKRVPDEIIEQVVSTIDDVNNAYSVAVVKARNLTQCDYQSFRRRLGDHLKRRGFGYGIIIKTVEQLWQERGVA
ncbi:MAG: recombination regulator RecX [Dehalococcoidales bacterium]|nr:recombination regulator RecX [Dehalococcoidales bacterium]